MHQVSPNPFNPITTVSFELPKADYVQVAVFNLAGQLIESLLQEKWLEAGYHEIAFNGTDKSSGIYIYRLTAGSLSATGKMILLM